MKKTLALLLACLAALALSGCASDPAADRNALYAADAKLAASADSHFASMSAYTLDGDALSMTAQAFTGMKTIWQYDAPEDGDVTMAYSLSVSKGGKAKLVLIAPDGGVTVLAENAGQAAMEGMEELIVPVMKGKNRMKVVGADGPYFTLVLEVGVGELVEK